MTVEQFIETEINKLKQPSDILDAVNAIKPLDFSTCLKHAFLSGVIAARNIPAHEPCDGPQLWTDYEPYVPGSYTRIATICAPALLNNWNK